ncbi:MAG: adenylate/guanylate cyclase domain-containing protein [Myxococcaceae bacterium]|nr:adenylate/guanylate cyclase domain-containing protein [Myxococcaceae bacterium]
MTREATLTSIRALRDEEERLLAEHGLKVERVISVLRLVLQVARLVAFGLTAFVGGHFTTLPAYVPARPFIVTAYLVFCIVTVWRVRTVSVNIRRSRVMPLIVITVDYTFILAMALTTPDFPEGAQSYVAAMFCMILLGFAGLRLRRMFVIYSAVLSVVVYGASVVRDRAEGQAVYGLQIVFTLVTFGVMTALVLELSSRVRQMFNTLRTRDNLRRFLPRAVADRVEQSHMHALDPVKREVTVLFSDIRDFTSTSETMDPAAVMTFLDDYFGRMSSVVQARGGTVGKFIGDGMLCYWGVPEEDLEHAEHAVQAALDMRAVVEELNRERVQAGAAAIKIGVGVHTGTVAAGELGGKGEGLHEYTVIGDSVNLASRIEGLTKQHHVDILVSENTWSRLGSRFVGHECGEERVKGRAEPVRIHAVTARTVASGSALA